MFSALRLLVGQCLALVCGQIVISNLYKNLRSEIDRAKYSVYNPAMTPEHEPRVMDKRADHSRK
ncbi:hypothetical protein BDV41DRAFT_304893 [Aspergillus transmontanensis]|uniref:Uncharacterized protein n=1 Tax=Aspergillus transmontanensis TaxID=1034304 RepID=A0A5N6VV61_9EURO|nr:hypothetical protein BDV41DRAFT_304893 [Aspergillus transmontanensis]